MAEHSGAGGDICCSCFAASLVTVCRLWAGIRSEREGAEAISKQPTVQVHAGVAWRTPQFWLLWLVLWLNVTAGIGILGMASPMLQEILPASYYPGSGLAGTYRIEQLKRIATMAAGFTGLLSLFNILGRFFWASVSDMCGRKATFALIFFLGTLFYGTLPLIEARRLRGVFVCALCVIISILRRRFRDHPGVSCRRIWLTNKVGAIHGPSADCWSAADQRPGAGQLFARVPAGAGGTREFMTRCWR